MATNSASASTGIGSTSAPTIVEVLTTKRNPELFANFLLCRLSDGSTKAQCKRCKKFLAKDSNTTLRLHLDKHCEGLRGVPEEGQHSLSRDGSIFSFSDEAVREQFAQLVVQEALPFNHFDNPRLTRVIQNTLQPRYNQVTRATLKRQCMKMWKSAKKELVELFENINTSVNLTTDVWSAPHGLPGSYLCVTAHWIDPITWQMMKRTIAFENFEYPHTGQNLFLMLQSVMSYFKIEQKVFTISFDNASNNTNAVGLLKLTYKPLLDGIFYHGRCVAHIINLVVGAGLGVEEINEIRKGFKEMLQDIFCSGNARYKNYMKLCKETNSVFLTPTWECPTRWNSTHKMWQNALRQKDTLKHFHDRLYNKGKVTKKFSDMGWATIQKMVELLQVFKDATTLVSGVYYPTSHLVLNQLWIICEKLGEFEFEGEMFDKMLVAMKSKLKKYFEEMPPVFTCAAALNPTLNVSGVEILLDKISYDLGLDEGDSFYSMRAKETFNQQFKSLFMIYSEKHGSTNASSSSSSFFSPKSSRDPTINLYNMVRQENTKRARGEGSSGGSRNSELGRYAQTDFLANMGYEEFSKFDILSWWQAREGQFPVLAAMARDLLSVQASTVALESAFSESGRVLSIRRTRLTPASLEMCICLKDHFDAMERTQNATSLEQDALEYEEAIQSEEVMEGASISLSDEEIQLNEAMRGNSEED